MKPIARAAVAERPSIASRAADFLELTKPRLNALTIAATLSALYLASPGMPDSALMLHVFLATSCVAGAAAVLNQVAERDRDALMERTSDRPLPGGRMSVATATSFGLLLAIGGVTWFATFVNLASAGIAAVTIAIYLGLYTPLKSRTWHNTLVGAVPGALPILLGWVSAKGTLSSLAIILFALVFCWQVPHFLAIATVHRRDYAAGGFLMLPVIDLTGRRTAWMVGTFSLVLLPLSLLPSWLGYCGWVYPLVAAGLGLGFWALAMQFAFCQTPVIARRLFMASIIYLPLLLIVMMLDKS